MQRMASPVQSRSLETTRRNSGSRLRHFEVLQVRDTGRTVGNGSYATVKEVTFRGLKCVGKKIHSELYDGAPPASQKEMLDKFSCECDLLSRLHHPCIVQFLGVYFEQDSQLPVMVMEYLHSTLSACIEEKGVLPEEISYGIFKDVGWGLRYLHEHVPPIIHRDLSANNVLLTGDMRAKISDLGVAKILNLSYSQLAQITQTQAPGTPVYMPPEALVARPKYTNKVDIFSYGVLIIHVLSGQWPIPGEAFEVDPSDSGTVVPVMEVERRKVYLDAIGRNHPLMNIITLCLSNKSEHRPQVSTVLSHITRVEETLVGRESGNRLELMMALRRTRRELEVVRGSAEKEHQRLLEANEDLLRQLEVCRVELEEVRGRKVAERNANRVTLPQAFNPEHQIYWSRCSDLPNGRDKPQAVAIGNRVYLGTGESDERSRFQVYEFDLSNDRWLSLPLAPVYLFALAKFRGKLITVGGAKPVNGVTGKLHCFDKDAGKWGEFLFPMPTGRWGLSVVTNDSTIVAVGGATGFGDGNICANVEVYLSRTNLWHVVEPLPFSCWLTSIALISNTVYVLGGFDRSNRSTRSAIYSPLSLLTEGNPSSWKTLPDIPLKRPAACSLNGSLLAIGGRLLDGQSSELVYSFEPSKWSWEPVDLGMPEATCTPSAVEISGGRVLVLGGWERGKKCTVFLGTLNAADKADLN